MARRCYHDVLTLSAAGLVLLQLLIALGGSITTTHVEGRAIPNADVTLNFTLDYQVAYGRGFVIAGNISELGNWIPQDAPLMNVISGVSFWSVLVTVAEGTPFEYKPVLVDYDTKQAIEWYSGSNLLYMAICSGRVLVPWAGNSVIQQVV